MTRERTPEAIERALYVGAHFGFSPVDAPRVTDKDAEAVKDCLDDSLTEDEQKLFDPAEKAAFLRVYEERGYASLPHPLAVCYKKPGKAGAKKNEYSFELAGFQGGCAEALLIRTALSALSEEGIRSLTIDLNSIGDKESIAAYERELGNYSRKIAEELDPELRKRIRKNAYELIKVVREAEHLAKSPAFERVPSSLASLSSASRAHFKEVLEHVEALGTEFRLAPTLIGNRTFCSETIFAIRNSDTNAILALGYRYSRLSKKIGFKKEVPFAGVSIFLSSAASEKQRVYKDLPRPKFYLVQLGRDAKMKTLPLIELLRQNKIPVAHGVLRDKIGAQMEGAEKARVPYLLILGQKEALEDSVTVRNVSTRAQDTIYIRDLPQYLKNLPF